VTDRAPAGGWRQAEVHAADHPDRHGVRLRLAVPDRVEHWSGQHYVIRLRAPDGYTAQRSYSIASAPAEDLLEFYVERLTDGEVSGYLASQVRPGDLLEVRGPIGGWFVWRGDSPAVGLAGGSGVVPFISMLRHAQRIGSADRLALAVSATGLDRLPYAEELQAAGALLALSREVPPNGRAPGRLRVEDVQGLQPAAAGIGFVCGSASFAETASQLLVAAGLSTDRIRVERFGPTG
jgi:ferredoxin-NADP reductase